jgi:hypothetical protein
MHDFCFSGGKESKFTITALKSRKMLIGFPEISNMSRSNSASPASVRE